ncbi:MAG: diguanylate cyclase [Candidatus Omnitrophota bacterium]
METTSYYQQLHEEIVNILRKYIHDKDSIILATAQGIIYNEAHSWYPQILKELVNFDFTPPEAKNIFYKVLTHRNGLCANLQRHVSLAMAALDYFTFVDNRLNCPIIIEAERKSELLGLSTHDELTGVLNRRSYSEIISREAERSLRYNQVFSLVVIDIDHFKEYNDTYGHAQGDVALKKIAEALSFNIRNCDYVFRYGGEEFVVVLTNTSTKKALAVIEKLRKIIKGIPFKRQVTVSAGACCFLVDTREIDECFSLADGCLYQAKQEGRDKTCVYFLEKRSSVIAYKRYIKPLLAILKRNKLIAFLGLLVLLSLAANSLFWYFDRGYSQGKWLLVFEDDFNRKRVGPNWQAFQVLPAGIYKEVKPGSRSIPWKIKRGELCAQSYKTASFLAYAEAIQGDVRLEFDARLVFSGAHSIGAFICGENRDNGYTFHLGEGKNGRTVLTRANAVASVSSSFKLKPEKKYHVVIERVNGDVRLSVNRKITVNFKDYFPLEGDGHNSFGLDVFDSHVHFDNIKVYRLSLPLRVSPLLTANSLFENKLFDPAINQYQEIVRSFPGKEIAARALYQMARCYMALENFPEAKASLYQLLANYSGHPLSAYALITIGFISEKEGNIDTAEEVVRECKRKYPSGAVINTVILNYLKEVYHLMESPDAEKIRLAERKVSFLSAMFPLQFPLYKDVFDGLIGRYMLIDEYDEARRVLKQYNRILSLHVKGKVNAVANAKAITEGELFALQGNFKMAYDVWSSIDKADSDYPDGAYRAAIASWKMGKFKEAFSVLRRLPQAELEYRFIPLFAALLQDYLGDVREKNKQLDSVVLFLSDMEQEDVNDTLINLVAFFRGNKELSDLIAMEHLYNFKCDIWFLIGEKCFYDKKWPDAYLAYQKFMQDPLTRKGITSYCAAQRLKQLQGMGIGVVENAALKGTELNINK